MRTVTLDELTIEDESGFEGIAVYGDLKEILRRAGYRFQVLTAKGESHWNRALFLNLTYWAASAGGDVLADAHIAADVVAHVAWHHLASKEVGSTSVDAMFLGESIASAFDLYLVGRLLAMSGTSGFLDTQVPAMAEAAHAAGLPERKFEALLRDVATKPEKAFEDLRALLFTVTRALYDCTTAVEAEEIFARFEKHRFAPLLHHYELSNWLLFARAHAKSSAPDAAVSAIHEALAAAKDPVEWLTERWVAPALP